MENDVCSRCNGSGEYSYSQKYGTVCFKCGGTGKKSIVKDVVPYMKIDAKVERKQPEIECEMCGTKITKLFHVDYEDKSGRPISTDLEICSDNCLDRMGDMYGDMESDIDYEQLEQNLNDDMYEAESLFNDDDLGW